MGDSTSFIPSALGTETTLDAAPPLTTTFVPPSSCLASTAIWTVLDGPYYLQGPRMAQSKCFPESYTPTNKAFYSPGICPSGYTEACSWNKVVAPLTETHYTCCPSFPSTTFGCRGANNNENPWDATLGCVTYFTDPLTIAPGLKTLLHGSVTPAKTTDQVIKPGGATGTIHAHSIHIATQSSSGSPSTSPTKGAGNGNSRSHSGVAIGVGVGVGVAVLLLIVGGYLLWRRRSAKKAEAEKATYSAVETQPGTEGGGGGGYPSPAAYPGTGCSPAPPSSYYPGGGVSSVTPSSMAKTPQSAMMTAGGGYQAPTPPGFQTPANGFQTQAQPAVEMNSWTPPVELPATREAAELPPATAPADGTPQRPAEIG